MNTFCPLLLSKASFSEVPVVLCFFVGLVGECVVCPGFSWDGANLLPGSWHSAVFAFSMRIT